MSESDPERAGQGAPEGADDPAVPTAQVEVRKPRMTRGELLALVAILAVVCGLIALAGSDVWGTWFSVEKTPTP